jgi:hypothetical protein
MAVGSEIIQNIDDEVGMKQTILYALIATLIGIPTAAKADEAESQFKKDYQALVDSYQDKTVSVRFNSAEKNLDGFFNALLHQGIVVEHSDEWFFQYREAVEEATKHNWEAADNKLSDAIKLSKLTEQPTSWNHNKRNACFADIWFVSALVHEAGRKYQDSLNELRLLFELHKNEPDTWNANSEVFHVLPTRLVPNSR